LALAKIIKAKLKYFNFIWPMQVSLRFSLFAQSLHILK
jgi:hypothetical protein